MDTVNRENAVLSSFLYADDMGTDKSKAFMLDPNIFTSSYRRSVAEKINQETEADKMYGYLSITLEDHTKGTAFEQEWINILAQTPMPFTMVEKTTDDLKKEYKKRLGRSFR